MESLLYFPSVNTSEVMDTIVIEEEINGGDNCRISDFMANLSQYTFPNHEELTKPLTWHQYVKIILYLIILILALVGNVTVILTVLLNRSMRTTINYYLVNLAATDLLVCIGCMWVPLVNSLTEPMFVLGAFMCKFNPFAQMTSQTSSVLTLSAISCDRFVAILFPLHVRITKQRTGAVITVIWIIATAVSIPFLVFNKQAEIEWKDIVEVHCTDQWPREISWNSKTLSCIIKYPSKQIYYTFVTLTLYFLPVAIMATAYALIIWRLWKTELPGERNLANINVQHRAKKKVIKMVCAVLFGFMFCWTPLQIMVLYSQFGHSTDSNGTLPGWFNAFTYFSIFLAYSNSALNPVLYGGFNNNFRQGLLSVLKCGYTTPNFGRPQFSRKSRTTTMSGITGSPSTYRANGVSTHSTKAFELRALQENKPPKKEDYHHLIQPKSSGNVMT